MLFQANVIHSFKNGELTPEYEFGISHILDVSLLNKLQKHPELLPPVWWLSQQNAPEGIIWKHIIIESVKGFMYSAPFNPIYIIDQEKVYSGGIYSLMKGGEFYSVHSIFDFMEWEIRTDRKVISMESKIYFGDRGTLLSNVLKVPYGKMEQYGLYLDCMFKTMTKLDASSYSEQRKIYDRVYEYIKDQK